eukprot:scaffold351_cov248-Pinguiococcus_pyrenoidosus.AAC.10
MAYSSSMVGYTSSKGALKSFGFGVALGPTPSSSWISVLQSGANAANPEDPAPATRLLNILLSTVAAQARTFIPGIRSSSEKLLIPRRCITAASFALDPTLHEVSRTTTSSTLAGQIAAAPNRASGLASRTDRTRTAEEWPSAPPEVSPTPAEQLPWPVAPAPRSPPRQGAPLSWATSPEVCWRRRRARESGAPTSAIPPSRCQLAGKLRSRRASSTAPAQTLRETRPEGALAFPGRRRRRGSKQRVPGNFRKRGGGRALRGSHQGHHLSSYLWLRLALAALLDDGGLLVRSEAALRIGVISTRNYPSLSRGRCQRAVGAALPKQP